METSNIEVWNRHYLRPESKQSYPDEALVRLIRTLPLPEKAPDATDTELLTEKEQRWDKSERSLMRSQGMSANSSSKPESNPDPENSASMFRYFALDFGCGSGRHIPLLLESGYETSGCDSSKNAIDHCIELYPGARFSLSVDFSIPASPAEDGLYDVIVCWGVLHYMPAREASRLLMQLEKALRPGGFLLGTLRKDSDTHFQHSAVSESSIHLASEEDLKGLLSGSFADFEYGYMERTPLGKMDQIVAHWFFRARKLVS